MSGRWVEQQTPFTSLLDLCEAVEALEGYQIVGHVDFIDDLKRLEEDMNVAAAALEAAVNGVDMGTLDATLTALEGSDEELARFRGSIAADVSASDASLTNLMGAMDTYNQAEEAYRSALSSSITARPGSITIQTPEGQKSLEMMHGRYRYREYVSGYSTNTLGWIDRLGSAYSDVGAQRTKALDKKRNNAASEKVQRVRISLEQRVQHARELAMRAEQEELRRSRDREVMNIAKKNGFKVKRKVVGKKVQYALVRQR